MNLEILPKDARKALLDMLGAPVSFIEALEDCVDQEDWDGIISMYSFHRELRIAVFETYFYLMPDEYKYKFVICAYAYGGDESGVVRKEMRRAERYGTPKWPAELASQDVLTVYRAGTESIERAKYSISWTVDLDRALWFHKYNQLRRKGESRIYKAKIRKKDAKAYTDCRSEQEVMQYRKVYDIEDITEQVVHDNE